MSLKIKKKSGSSVPPLDAGTYLAVCVGIVDLGEQYSDAFKKYNDRQIFIWEIPSQTVQIDGEEKPRFLNKEFTSSLHEKSDLHKMLVSWRGKAFTEQELADGEDGFMRFSVLDMLGAGCFLQVIVDEKDSGIYNKITSVIGLPVGMDAPTAKTTPYSFDVDTWDDETFKTLPDWIQDKIKKSTQYKTLHTPTDEIDFQKDTPVAPSQEAPVNEKESCPI